MIQYKTRGFTQKFINLPSSHPGLDLSNHLLLQKSCETIPLKHSLNKISPTKQLAQEFLWPVDPPPAAEQSALAASLLL
jgi:hypothetical protein